LFGVIFIVGQGLSTLALMSLMVSRLAGHTDLVKKVEPRYFRDPGQPDAGLYAAVGLHELLAVPDLLVGQHRRRSGVFH
jgi:hypothetical protein